MPPTKNINIFNIMLAVLMFQFSAKTANTGPIIPAGAIKARVTKLVQKVDSVISHVSQPTPIFWTQRPNKATVLLRKYSVKGLFYKAVIIREIFQLQR